MIPLPKTTLNIHMQPAIQPSARLIQNNPKKGEKVLSAIEEGLLSCIGFQISVAFITLSGITPLLSILKELEERKVPGRILTTDYLTFSEPKALAKLMELSNLEIRLFQSDEEGFHTKGYLFQKKDSSWTTIVGSSNLTIAALTKNHEWNVSIGSQEESHLAQSILDEFEELWNSRYTVPYKDIQARYEQQFAMVKAQRAMAASQPKLRIQQYMLQPNSMQVDFTRTLMELKDKGEHKALLISATGTGKTYAAAFALRQMDPKKVLFLVHREQIARQAMESFQNVIGQKATYALVSGSHPLKEAVDAQYIFSTIQTLSRTENLESLEPNLFETIVIDEVHRAGAASYQKIMDYFHPAFWLGMSATPERSDDFDIYTAFDHNVACEIRLQQALELDLLCPFHYFGLTDVLVEEKNISEAAAFNRLTDTNRVDHILEQARYYGYSGSRVKGLVFVSRNEESRKLSEMFNERGLKTTWLDGSCSQEAREEAIQRLTGNNREDSLDYIFSVDIFNEGVDIPEINQVILLRPTQSAIVFVQQLGRGLRKSKEKEYVVVLDFISNYERNYLIPIALSGQRSYNKDSLRSFVREGNRFLPGASSIHFDAISRQRIFQALDAANFNDVRLIKEAYQELKAKLGRIPRLVDFEVWNALDPQRIFDSKSLGSWYTFLHKYENDYQGKLSAQEALMLKFITASFGNGKRSLELEAMMVLLKKPEQFLAALDQNPPAGWNEKAKINLLNQFTADYASGAARNTFASCTLLQPAGTDWTIHDSFAAMLENPDFLDMLLQTLEFAIRRYEDRYARHKDGSGFVLYEKYTYADVCRLLNWQKNEVALNIGGYKYDKATNTYPVFINYEKDASISDTTRYEDTFLSPALLRAISKSGRTIASDDVQKALHAKENGTAMLLFVRKNKDDKISKEFYYLGNIQATGNVKEFVMPNTTKTAVEIDYALQTPVRQDIYDYIVHD